MNRMGSSRRSVAKHRFSFGVSPSSVPRSLSGSLIAELGPVLFILFILIVFPLADLVTYLCGVSTVQLVVNQASRAAATAETPAECLPAIKKAVSAVVNSGLGRFTRLKPVKGLDGTGIDLNVRVATGGATEKTFAVPTGLPLPKELKPKTANNKTDFIYEYQANGKFIVSPLIDMSGLPFLNTVPILTPTEIKFTSEHQVENLSALN